MGGCVGKGLWWCLDEEYDWKKDFGRDVVAGMSVGMLVVPQSMAHASICGVLPENGLASSRQCGSSASYLGGCHRKYLWKDVLLHRLLHLLVLFCCPCLFVLH